MKKFTMINFENFINNKQELRNSYKEAKPYQHICIDNFLTLEGIERLRSDNSTSIASTDDQSSDYLFAKNKHENNKLDKISPNFAELRLELISNEFKEFLEYLTDLPIFVDPDFTGGGLHQGGEGSFLEMHADFSRHPIRNDWVRELNILLYLNQGYDQSWGGALDLEHLETRDKANIDPVENRLVIMLSKSHTLHGYKKISFPKGFYRTSVAAYGYVQDDGSNPAGYSSTVWAPKTNLKKTIALIVNKLVPIKQVIFGSNTANRNSRKKN